MGREEKALVRNIKKLEEHDFTMTHPSQIFSSNAQMRFQTKKTFYVLNYSQFINLSKYQCFLIN